MMLKRILRLIFIGLVAFVVVKFSSFGWRFWGETFMGSEKDNIQLAEDLESCVHMLASEIGDRSVFKYDKLNEAVEYISGQFVSFGYNLEFQEYKVSGETVKNIIASKKGIRKSEETIIIGAHYDTCFNPGADDNASAVAGLIELARFMSKQQTDRTIKFIAFVNEEPPFFMTEDMGSRVYVRAAKARGEDIKAVLILEMIGYYSDKPNSQRYPPLVGLFYPNKGNFIAVVGNFNSRRLVKKTVSIFKNNTSFPVESLIAPAIIAGVDFSDHWSFWQEGYPAVMITDTAFYRNHHYHSQADTYEKLNYVKMAEVIRGLSSVLTELDREISL